MDHQRQSFGHCWIRLNRSSRSELPKTRIRIGYTKPNLLSSGFTIILPLLFINIWSSLPIVIHASSATASNSSPSSIHSIPNESSSSIHSSVFIEPSSSYKPTQIKSSNNVNTEKSYSLSECQSLQIASMQDQHSTNIKDYNCEELNFCDDKLGFEAILSLHRQLDDDANGDIDISESNEFLRDELKYESGANDRQKAFHGNDKHITVDELWRSWMISAVHNWSVEETADWLCNVVELPQYRARFELHAIDGTALPRLAANPQFSNIIGINNMIHRQKISLKATDIVLFGVPKPNTMVKDLILVGLVVVAFAISWFAFKQHKYSQIHLKKMMKDMESLSSAAKQLESLQAELNKTKQEHENASKEKMALEMKLKQTKQKMAGTPPTDDETAIVDDQRTAEMEAQLTAVSDELRRYKNAFNAQQWIPPLKLQSFLQLTYEIEIKNYNAKKAAAEMQLHAARDECDKLKKKRSTLLGAFRVAHGSSIDYVDNTILQARTLMGELTKEMQERIKRWKLIENFCGFDIIHNPGLIALEKMLYGTIVSNNSIQTPMSSSSGVSSSTFHLYQRKPNESSNDDKMDTVSLKSSYSTMNMVSSQWNNSALKNVRTASVYTNFQPSTPPNERTIMEEDCGLLMIARSNEEQTLANNNGKPIYNSKRSGTQVELATNAIPRSNSKVSTFRRGSSDGVEKHFEEQYLTQLGSQSDSSIRCNKKRSVTSVCKEETFHHPQSIHTLLSKKLHDINDEIISSSSSESSTTTNYNTKSVASNDDLDSCESNSITEPEKKRSFFGLRKRKSYPKLTKTKDS